MDIKADKNNNIKIDKYILDKGYNDNEVLRLRGLGTLHLLTIQPILIESKKAEGKSNVKVNPKRRRTNNSDGSPANLAEIIRSPSGSTEYTRHSLC